MKTSGKIDRKDIVFVIYEGSASVSYKGKTVCFSKDDKRFSDLLYALETNGPIDFLSGVDASNTLKELFDL